MSLFEPEFIEVMKRLKKVTGKKKEEEKETNNHKEDLENPDNKDTTG